MTEASGTKTPAPEKSTKEASSGQALSGQATETKTQTQSGQALSGQGKEGGFVKKNIQRHGSRKPRSEYDQKILNIRRVTRVMKGGRRFSFSVSIVIGNKKGAVGVGMGKAGDTALAIEKAYNNAKKNLVTLDLTEEKSIPHEVHARYTASEVMVRPSPGKGVIAGSSVRTVLVLAGMNDVSAKVFSRSKNQFNNAKAAIKALDRFRA